MNPTSVWPRRSTATDSDQDQLGVGASAAPQQCILPSYGPRRHGARPRSAATIALAICAAITGCVNPGVAVSPSTLVHVIARAAPAVVGIAEDAAESVTPDSAPSGQVTGSGFRIEHTTLVATAAHVVLALRGTPVVVWNGQRWNARIRVVDRQSDLALLDIDSAARLPGLALANSPPDDPGTWVVVLGCPFGTLPTATIGIVSARPGAILRPEPLQHQLQLNAAINPGNSGGPVVNLNAEVIGIATAQVPGSYGLGFAVPVATLRRLIAEHR